jgi:MFS family permease
MIVESYHRPVKTSRRNVRYIAAARFISASGTAAATIALAYTIYEQTHSAFLLSAVFFLTVGVTGLLSPVAGALSDHFDRRHVMIACDLLGACLYGALAFIGRPLAMLTIAFLAAVAETPFVPASSAAIPNLVRESDLAWANGIVSMTTWTGRLVGYSVSGAVLALVGARAVFGVNALSFVGSAGIILCNRADFSVGRNLGASSSHSKLLDGFRHVRGDSVLVTIAVAWALAFFAVDVSFVANVPLAREFGKGSLGYGLLQAGFAGGAAIGGLGARWLHKRWERAALMNAALSAGLGYLVVAQTPVFSVALVAVFVSAVCDSVGAVASNSIIQRHSPDYVRARVFAAFETVGLTANAIAFVVAGLLLHFLGGRGLYAVGGLCALGVAMLFAFRVPPWGRRK